MKFILLSVAFITATSLFGQRAINGRVLSAADGEPLPFATLSFKGTSQGTITNKEGMFTLLIPEEYAEGVLLVSYLGYEAKEVPLGTDVRTLTIQLDEAILQLDDIIVTPLAPTEYIKRAVRKIPQNYASKPFGTLGYYRESFVENDYFINGSEGIFKSYYPAYLDTLKNQHQLLLYRQASDLRDMEFAERWLDKRMEKEQKKAKKKGEEPEEFDVSEEIREGFGGPDNILSMDLSEGDEDCLDSTQFNKFRYEFDNGVKYYGKDLLVIKFETKRVVDHTRQEGKIFIDIESDAIVALEYEGEAVIPVVVRPILFAFGLGIENPQFVKKIRYQPVGEYWYPENFQWHVNMNLVKRYMFHKNDKSDFFIEQLFKINNIQTNDPSEVPEDHRFKGRDKMADQVYNPGHLKWEDVDTLLPDS